MTIGQDYQIDIVVKDAAGNVLVSGPITIGPTADPEDIRDTIAGALGDLGLEIVPMGKAGLRLASNGDTKLGAITYDTFVKDVPAPKLAGPQVRASTGTAKLTVNGAAIAP